MKKLVTLALFLLLTFSVQAFAKEEIRWLIWELNPEFIAKGKEKGQGYADKFLQTFIEKLPEYKHTIVWLNTRRWFLESSKKGRCTPHIWKRFKLDEQYYSDAYTLTPPHGILIHKKNQKRFGELDSILSLKAILNDTNLTLAVPIFRYKKEASRYPILYKYFEPHIGKNHLKEVTTSSNETSPRMLDTNRADYLIAYPTTATAYSRINEKENNYLFYTIKEDPYYKKIHVSCDKSTLGKEVIEKINQFITPELHHKFLSFHEEWNDKNPQFRQTYIDYFINSNNNGTVIK